MRHVLAVQGVQLFQVVELGVVIIVFVHGVLHHLVASQVFMVIVLWKAKLILLGTSHGVRAIAASSSGKIA